MAPVPISAGSRGGDSLHLPAGALLCPPSMVCFLSAFRCCWPPLSVSGVRSLYQELPLGVHASHPEGCLAQVLQEWALKATSEQPQALGGECSDLGHCLLPCVLTREIHSKEQRNRISATPHEGCPSSSVLGRQPSQEDSDYCHSTNYRRCRISMFCHQTGMKLYIK